MFKTSIRNKLMGLLLAATIIPIATSIFMSYVYTKKTVTEESIGRNLNLISLGKSNIENYMETINQTSLSVYNDLHKPNSLFGIVERESRHATKDTDILGNWKTIFSHLLNMYQNKRDILQIHLQLEPDNRAYLLARGQFRGPAVGNYTIPYPPHADPAAPFMEATHMSHSYNAQWNMNAKPENVFTLHRPILNTPGEQVIGYLSIDVKVQGLFAICGQLYDPNVETLYIIDRQGNAIYADSPEQLGKPLTEGWVSKLTEANEDSGYFEWSDKQFAGLVTYDRIKTNYMDWTIVKRQTFAHLYSNATQIAKMNTFIAAVFLVIVIIATLYISLHFSERIKKLINYMNKAQSGNLNFDIRMQSNDEIGILGRRFDAMIQTINDLINREYKLEIANKTNQLKAMQAQINPHFINNALQSIGTLALQLQAPKLYSLISSLARIMRYNMTTSEPIVPLSTEISHIKAYLDLQKNRFGERLDVIYEIAEQTEQKQVPKMLLQPIIENYFKHGYHTRPDEIAQIRIASTLRPDGQLVITIEDNGAGMEPDKLAELQNLLGKPNLSLMEGQEHIGLSNVLIRLRLYFGEDASMTVGSKEPHGFIVTLTIPYVQGEGEQP